MIEQALVYLYSVQPTRRFVGCGVLVEGGYVATCVAVNDRKCLEVAWRLVFALVVLWVVSEAAITFAIWAFNIPEERF